MAAGGLVAFPTETVYGLGADAAQRRGHRPPLRRQGPAGLQSADRACGGCRGRAALLAHFDAAADALAAAFWPGPLTLVLPKRPDCGVADLALAGLDSIAVRVPAHPIAQSLLKAFGGPVVAPSANRSGHVSPTSAAHVLADLRGRIDMVIDAGPCAVGVESTIVACLERADLAAARRTAARSDRARARPAAWRVPPVADDAPLAPGMLASHYAPKARLRLDADAPRAGEALLAFGPAPAFSGTTLNLSARGDLIEAAANLFSHLRALDASGAKTIAVMRVPHEDLGEAINDRLARAAAPRTGLA